MSVKTYETHSELFEDMCCGQLIAMGIEVDDEKFIGWLHEMKGEFLLHKTKVIMFFGEGYDNEVIDSRIALAIEHLGDLKVDVYDNVSEDEIQKIYDLSNIANKAFDTFVDDYKKRKVIKELENNNDED